MKLSILAVAACAAVCAAAPSKKALKFGFTKSYSENELVARSKSADIPITNYFNIQYWVHIGVGTPAQWFDVALDTGSSYTWVRAWGEPGQYNSSASSTYKFQDWGFYVSYGDGGDTSGAWVKDTLTVGGVTLEQFEFGASNKSAEPQILALGNPDGLETSFASRVAKDGYTNTAAYSLYLNSYETKTGSLLMGAVDTSKIDGGLALVSLLNYYDFAVTMDGIAFKGSKALDVPRLTLLDSGTSVSQIPSTSYWTLVRLLDLYQTSAGPVASQSQYDAWKKEGAHLTFSLQGKEIHVPMEQLFFALSNYVTTANGQEKAYVWRIAETKDTGQLILGDGFLRAAYVVYDVENKQVALGQAKYGGEETLEEIVSGSDGIPSATKAPSSVTWSTDHPFTTSASKPTSTAALGPKTG
ncbi:Candidapepsin-10 [Yarrowia sp. B02]|nr:Candidapepsin-10 [Yarrowia sp. B02]